METELKHLNAVIREKKKRIETTKYGCTFCLPERLSFAFPVVSLICFLYPVR